MHIKLTFFIGIILLILSPISHSANCGKIKGHQIISYGGLSCLHAKKIYRLFEAGHIPKGWTCGQSVGGCGKGKQGFTFKL